MCGQVKNLQGKKVKRAEVVLARCCWVCGCEMKTSENQTNGKKWRSNEKTSTSNDEIDHLDGSTHEHTSPN